MSQEAEISVWNNYALSRRTILAINKEAGHAFLVNPTAEVKNLFAKEIEMPEDFSIRVYRISTSAPQMLPFKFGGDFNIIDKEYRLFGNSVYFTKYDSNSVEADYSSNHYITFLTHEAFHYFMQSNWTVSGRFDTSVLTEKDLDLMEEEYEVLEKIYKALENGNKDELMSLTSDYVSAVKQRIEQNPEYMQEELQAETNEGTATYVGLNASRMVGYDYKIMHFNASSVGGEVVEWPFDTVVPMIKNGECSKDAIATDLVYQTGSLLCELLDALEVPDWQERLNEQTSQLPVTLYSLLAEYLLDGGM